MFLCIEPLSVSQRETSPFLLKNLDIELLGATCALTCLRGAVDVYFSEIKSQKYGVPQI